MKAFEIREFGIENLSLQDREKPSPANGQVLVRMTAASLNYRDLLMVKGTYSSRLKGPLVPLSDGAGVVEQIGSGVTRFKVGDRVTPIFMQSWIAGPISYAASQSALGGALDGVLREYAVFSEHGLVPTPGYLSDEEAAALPCAAVTAWHALFEHTPIKPGDVVLVQGTGGVSLFALQFAAAAGARVILTTSDHAKARRATELGAAETINYQEHPEWHEQARDLTGGIGVDHIIEVGGSDTLPRSLKAVRTGGTVSVIGVLSGRESTVSPGPILANSLRLQGIYVGSRVMFENMIKLLDSSKIKPVIDCVMSWTEFPDALRVMEGRSHIGKICLTFAS